MANKYRGEAEVMLGGKLRRVAYTMNAIAELEGLLGAGAMGLLTALGDEGRAADAQHFRLARALLLVGLREAGARGATLQNVGARMQFDELPDYLHVCLGALMASLGVDRKKAAESKAAAEGQDAAKGEQDPLAVTAPPASGEASSSSSSGSGPSA